VKAALTSLSSNRTVGSRKRGRNKSIENPNKKSKKNSNDIILSNFTQSHTMILATSGLNNQQMVCFFDFIFSF